jgi:hypothetical protein
MSPHDECTWYKSWREGSELVRIDQCHLWDEARQRCERNEACPRPWERKK